MIEAKHWHSLQWNNCGSKGISGVPNIFLSVNYLQSRFKFRVFSVNFPVQSFSKYDLSDWRSYLWFSLKKKQTRCHNYDLRSWLWFWYKKKPTKKRRAPVLYSLDSYRKDSLTIFFSAYFSPQYGGRQCTGSDVVAEMCNVQPCSTSQRNFQEEQCSATDSEPIQGHTYHWVPNPGALGLISYFFN